MEYSKVAMRKKEFVQKELSALLRKIDPSIKGAEYFSDENKETVRVYFENFKTDVDVTCDSLAALTQDVLKVAVL